MPDSAFLITAFATLFVVIDPPGLVPMFIALTTGMILVTFVFLLASAPLERLLGRTGTLVITRLLGMLLAALAVQFVIDGVRGTGLIG